MYTASKYYNHCSTYIFLPRLLEKTVLIISTCIQPTDLVISKRTPVSLLLLMKELFSTLIDVFESIIIRSTLPVLLKKVFIKRQSYILMLALLECTQSPTSLENSRTSLANRIEVRASNN